MFTSPGWAGRTANIIKPLERPRSRDVVVVVVVNIVAVVVIVAKDGGDTDLAWLDQLLLAPETWR